MTHADVRELIACYAVGALGEQDSSLVQEHLVGCGFCTNLAREASEIAHYLPYAAPSLPVPAAGLERLLATVAPQTSSATQAAAVPTPERPGGPANSGARQPALALAGRTTGRVQGLLQRWLANLRAPLFAPVATAIVLVLGLAGWNMMLMSDLKEERRQMSNLQGRLAQQTHLMVMVTSDSAVTKPLEGTPLAPSAEVRLIMDGETNSAMVMATRLPPLPPDRVYQVWLGRQGARMPAGRLVVDDQGDGECNLQLDGSIHSYDSAWITLEPARGGPMPNSPGVAKGFL